MSDPARLRPVDEPDPEDSRFSDGRVPPNALDAEAAVVSAVLLSSAALDDVRPILAPHQFYSDANRRIYEAFLDLSKSGHPIDILTVRSWLDDRDMLQRVGGAKYLAQICDTVPAIAHVEEYARAIVAKARAREAINSFRRLSAEGYGAVDVDALLDEAQRDLDALKAGAVRASPFDLEEAEAIFKKLDPIRWVCRDLVIGPGRPTLIAGYGYSGKTLFLQSFLIAAATGTRAWGKFRVEQGRALHLDYEQGKHATKRRYQRMAFASGFTAQELAGNLALKCFPSVYLTTPGIEDMLVRLCDGVDVCGIDSFRAACPNVDENSSEVRIYLDILTRVSERTGCAFLVLHHAGKSSPDKDKREAARGSSAIFDASGTMITLRAKEKFAPVDVEIVKTSASYEGKVDGEFVLRFEDVSNDDASDMQAGLRLVHITREQVNPPKSFEQIRAEVEADLLQILTADRARATLAHRPWPGMSGNAIRGLYRGKDTKLIAPSLEALLASGRVTSARRDGRGGGVIWGLPDDSGAE